MTEDGSLYSVGQAEARRLLQKEDRNRPDAVPQAKSAWDEALRVAETDGDLSLLGALLWRAPPDGKGSTPLPTEFAYALARLFTPPYPGKAKLIVEPATKREQETSQHHERIALEMLALIESGKSFEQAAETAAEKFGVSERTAKAAWKLVPSSWRPSRRTKATGA